MAECDCLIGLLHHYEYSELITLEGLKEHIADNIEFNMSLDDDPVLRNAKHLRAKVWTLKTYGDLRRKTNISRFAYCPVCGAKIDWESIRRTDNERKAD